MVQQSVLPSTNTLDTPPRYANAAGRWSWVMIDWAQQPFYTLIISFLFGPYLVNHVIGDPVWGQTVWGLGLGLAGLLMALTSPIMGAYADLAGRRKPIMAVFALGFTLGMAGLWLAEPATPMLWLVMASFILAALMAEYLSVFTNAMMPTLVPPERLGRLSATGWAMGYVGGLVALGLMAGLITTNPATGRTLLGLEPLIAFDLASRESDRFVGPASAVWFVLFVLPFFLFTPDRPSTARADASIRQALARLRATIREVSRYRTVAWFLLARMLYADGLAAVFTFGGVYGASVFGWGTFDLGLFGIFLLITATVGSVLGGPLDDRFGSKAVITVSLIGLIIAVTGVLSITATSVLFGLDVAPKAAGSAPFSSTGEMTYLGFAALIGVVAGPLQSASRTLMARLAPAEKMTEFFGLYAFSGKVTAFAAPAMIAAITAITESQRLGIAVVLGFLIAGLILLRLKVPDARFSD